LSWHQNLFNYLTNGTNGAFFLVEGPGINHGFFDIDPGGFLEAITGPICLLPLQKITAPIPTLSECGLIAMAGVLGIIGLLAIRRRKATV
jgi:hypothetical protein